MSGKITASLRKLPDQEVNSKQKNKADKSGSNALTLSILEGLAPLCGPDTDCRRQPHKKSGNPRRGLPDQRFKIVA